MKIIHYSLSICYVITFIFFYIGCSSGDTRVPDPPPPPYYPACIEPLGLKILTFEYDYMDRLESINDSMYCLRSLSAINFGFGKTKISLWPTTNGGWLGYGTKNPREIINTGSGSDIAITNALKDYVNGHYNDSINWTYSYLVGIDRISADAVDTNRVGRSGHFYNNLTYVRRWAAVYYGKMRINGFQNVDTFAFINAMTFHELGHSILGLNMYEEELHSGVDSACCVMQEEGLVASENCVVMDYRFCDYHCCYGRRYVDSNPYYTQMKNYNNFVKRHKFKNIKNNFDIQLISNKTEYIEGEPIWLTVKAKNNSGSVDSLIFFNEGDIAKDLLIKNSNNQNLNYLGDLWTYIKIPYAIFQPGEEKEIDVQILYSHGNNPNANEFGNFGLNYYLTEGQYTLTAILDKKNIISNDIRIKIKNTQGSEIEAFENLKEIYRMPTYSVNALKNKLNAYLNFSIKYPNSAYKENAFFYYSLIVRLNSFEEYINNDFIDNHVNFITSNIESYYSYEILSNLSYALMIKNNNESKAVDYLNEIFEKYPNTRLGDAATKILAKKTYK